MMVSLLLFLFTASGIALATSFQLHRDMPRVKCKSTRITETKILCRFATGHPVSAYDLKIRLFTKYLAIVSSGTIAAAVSNLGKILKIKIMYNDNVKLGSANAVQGAIKASSINESKEAALLIQRCLNKMNEIELLAKDGNYDSIGKILASPDFQGIENASSILVRSDALTADEKV